MCIIALYHFFLLQVYILLLDYRKGKTQENTSFSLHVKKIILNDVCCASPTVTDHSHLSSQIFFSSFM